MSVRVAAAAGAPVFLALGCVGFLASPALAEETDLLAAAQTDVRQPGDRDIVVTGERGRQRLESPKSTSDLLDTPQTVTVISDQVLRRQNLLTLRDALATLPGITFGAGEGGGGYGDATTLRGYSASNDITQDGVRDSAQYSRTDPFNLQQIEVYNGANSVFNGSGSVGGTINLVSKVPQPSNLTVLEAGVGTDDYYRATVDSNWRLNDLVAVRVNGMFHRNDYPGRDVERFKRWGIAPSVTIGIESDTKATVSYVHQEDDNTPTYGVPFYITDTNSGPHQGVQRSYYFGIENLDRQKITTDRATLQVDHRFGDQLSFRNLTRWQRIHQPSQTSAPQEIGRAHV